MTNAHTEAGSTRHKPGPGPVIVIADAALEHQPAKDLTRPQGEATRRQRPVFWLRAVAPVLTSLPINNEPGATAKAIFSEIRTHVEGLGEQGRKHSIDLRFLKSMPEERAILAALLGHGEVSAIVDSVGRSEIHETAIPCVWWVSHLGSDNETVGELIEIATIPELLLGDVQAIAPALEALRARELSGAH